MDKVNATLPPQDDNEALVEDIPPPPFTRQPPDGHEFPHNCTDPVDIKRDEFKSIIAPHHKSSDCSSGSPTGLEDSGVFLDDPTPGQWKSANGEARTSPTTVLLTDIPQEEFRKAYTTLGNEAVTSLSENNLLNTCCNMRDNRELLRDFDADSSSRSDIGTSSCSDSMDELDSTPHFAKNVKDPPVPPPRSSVPPRSTGALANAYQEAKTENSVNTGRSSACISKTSSLKPASYTLEKTTATLTKDIELGGMILPDSSADAGSFQKSAHKWKSEENLRYPALSRYKGREQQTPLSVKERIAMFSKMDSDTALLTRNFSSESKKLDDTNRIKHAFSTDMLIDRDMLTSREITSKSQQTLDASTYRNSTSNLHKNLTPSSSNSDSDTVSKQQQYLRGNSSSPTGNLQYSAMSGLSKSTSNVSMLSKQSDIPASLTKPLSLLTDFSDVTRRDYQMVSAYPQTQLSQYKRYSSPALSYAGSLVQEDPLKRSSNTGSLLSILETRKERATKLKGLIIPDRPNASASSRQTLPTIASYTPIVLPKSETPAVSHPLQLVKADLSQPCRVSQSLPRGFDFKSVTNAQRDVIDGTAAVTRSIQPVLSEPPWKCTKATLPKYSPAFKRRTFELPRSTVSSSVSPTPPSSLTSPLSPPPSSPSSICSSTASSSTGAKSPTPSKHNIFQFSLSHSKPVTPLLPEKAIISPPPFSASSSDVEETSHRKSTDVGERAPPLPRQPPPAEVLNSASNKIVFPPLPTRPPLEKHLSADALMPTPSYSSQCITRRSDSNGSLWPSSSSSSSGAAEHSKSQSSTSYSDNRYSKAVSIGGAHAKESNMQYSTSTSKERLSFSNKEANSSINRSMDPMNRLDSLLNPSDNSISRKNTSETEFSYQTALSNPGNGFLEEEYRRKGSPNSSLYAGHSDASNPSHKVADSQHRRSSSSDYSGNRTCNQWTENGGRGTYHYTMRNLSGQELESDDDTNSLSSQKTEESMKHLQADADSSSDATSDSLDRALSPEFRPRAISQQKTVLRNNADSTDSVKNFRALAEKWQQRAADNPAAAARDVKSPPIPTTAILPSSVSTSGPAPAGATTRKDSPTQMANSSVSSTNVRLPPSLFPRQLEQQNAPVSATSPERKNSTPTTPTSPVAASAITTAAVRMRENRERTVPPSRPTSLIETRDRSRIESSMWDATLSSSSSYFRRTSTSSIKEFSELSPDSKEYRRSISDNVRDPVAERLKIRQSSSMSSSKQNSLSVSDIRKAFEGQQSYQNGSSTGTKHVPRKIPEDRSNLWSTKESATSIASRPRVPDHHVRMSSIDSTTSESDLSVPSHYASVGSLATSAPAEQYGSVTSLASTTSLISPQELQQLIDEANQSLEEAGTPTHEIHVVVLHRETTAGSIGITLAGGADYEVKEITVHKVITGSIADRDGRMRKGDRIISINGRNLKGVSHREALEILKAPRPEVVLVVSRERTDPFSPAEMTVLRELGKPNDFGSSGSGLRAKTSSAGVASETSATAVASPQTDCLCVQLMKDGTGLGFIIEGGKESPLGDRPLTVKRIFKGGIADRDGTLLPGDEIVSVNSQAVLNMTRTEAWNFMKKLPNGPVAIVVRRKT